MKTPFLLVVFAALPPTVMAAAPTWTVVDTGQVLCYGATRPLAPPADGAPFFGQDAQYAGAEAVYRDNGDGTVSDLRTGLMWSKAVDPRKVNLATARAQAAALRLGGFSDWRVPNIKELYSLIDFRGVTGTPTPGGAIPAAAVPYLNTDYFDFRYGDTAAGERFIDAQWLSDTTYTATTMDGAETVFGVNFADGRIKGYGMRNPRGEEKLFFVRFVRGPGLGANDWVDNRDGTVTDRATGLTWTQADSGRPLSWEEALRYAETLRVGGHEDWRLPNAKELQSLVDYSRAPATTQSAALDPVFAATEIRNEAGERDWPYYWTSTTHVDGPDARQAVYVAFGRAIGQMHGRVMDVHGAGAQRSDPKIGDARIGHGPQGDAQRVRNFVRAVRGGGVRPAGGTTASDPAKYPGTIRVAGAVRKPAPLTFEKPAGPPTEMPPGRPSGLAPGGPFLDRLDRNRDGRVAPDEFDGPREHFADFDRNRDGSITADEAPTGPPR